jgi:dTDP-4-amino-4,6-dideoxygalactose transaminase
VTMRWIWTMPVGGEECPRPVDEPEIPSATLVDLDVENSVPFNCVVRAPATLRDAVHAHLHAAGIQAGVHYPPNHLQPAFAPWSRPLPATEAVAGEILSLPFHPGLNGDDIDRITTTLDAALTGASTLLADQWGGR